MKQPKLVHYLFLLVASILLSPLSLQAQIITTVAGTSTSGFSGDGGVATEALLHYPRGVAVDSLGNLYIADSYNHRVRKVSASDGIITTVAGNGTRGFSGDRGLATAASFDGPHDLELDASGNLYITDVSNQRVRKVTGGIVTTIAGNGTDGFSGDEGPATGAALSHPGGLAVDSSGNLYIADVNNHRIRMVRKGIISTVAGNGTLGFDGDGDAATEAELNWPRDVAVDSSGDLFIADQNNHRVRRVREGVITTLAGNGADSSSGDGGAATEAELSGPDNIAVDSSGNLYIQGLHQVRKVSGTSPPEPLEAQVCTITTVAGTGTAGFLGDGRPATSARINFPIGLSFDDAGDLYFADSGNNRIRKIDSDGVITTVAGSGSSRFVSTIDGPATAFNLSGPRDVIMNSSGELYITDARCRVYKVASGGTISNFAGSGACGYWSDDGPAASAGLEYPYGLDLDAEENLYIAEYAGNRIRKITVSDNNIITTIGGTGTQAFSGDGGPATSADIGIIEGLGVAPNGDVYFADRSNSRFRRIAAESGIISTFAGNGLLGPFGGDGEAATAAAMYWPADVAASSTGPVYLATQWAHRVRKVSASGIISTIAGNGSAGYSGDGGPARDAQLNQPKGVALDAEGNLYIADYQNHRIRKVTCPPEADLAVTLNGTIQRGRLVYYSYITNNGPEAANDVTLTNTLPAGLSRLGSYPPGVCSGSGTVTCSLGTIAPGARRRVTLSVLAPRSGTVIDHVSVTTTSEDPDLTNNSLSISTVARRR